MYDKPMLSLEQAQSSIAAMITDYNRNPDCRKVDMAVVDDADNLLAYAHMDRCLLPTFAIRKAYISAARAVDTLTFTEQSASQNRSIESFGDPRLIVIPSGVAALKSGAVVGAIDVGGLPSGLDDESIAEAGLEGLNL